MLFHFLNFALILSVSILSCFKTYLCKILFIFFNLFFSLLAWKVLNAFASLVTQLFVKVLYCLHLSKYLFKHDLSSVYAFFFIIIFNILFLFALRILLFPASFILLKIFFNWLNLNNFFNLFFAKICSVCFLVIKALNLFWIIFAFSLAWANIVFLCHILKGNCNLYKLFFCFFLKNFFNKFSLFILSLISFFLYWILKNFCISWVHFTVWS